MAVENVCNAAFFSTGQKCTATAAPLLKTRSTISSWRAGGTHEETYGGDGMKAGIDIGPAWIKGRSIGAQYIAIAKKEGDEPLCGGKHLTGANTTRATSWSPPSSPT